LAAFWVSDLSVIGAIRYLEQPLGGSDFMRSLMIFALFLVTVFCAGAFAQALGKIN